LSSLKTLTKNLQPVTQALLRIDAAFTEELITDSGIKFYLDPTYSKEWHAAVVATIAKLPSRVLPHEQKIVDQLKVGDEVGISYSVVADFEFSGDGHRFLPSTDDNPHLREWMNGKGDRLGVYAMPKRKGIGVMWVGSCTDKHGNLISGEQGSEASVERWLAQFPLGKTDIYRHNNFFSHGGNDYWKCDLSQIFCKRKKGKMISVSNRVICEPIDEIIPANVLYLMQQGNEDIKVRYQDRARVISGGASKGIKPGMIIHFQPRHIEKYEMWGQQTYLINENLVQGVFE
jgi:hypothetical protein